MWALRQAGAQWLNRELNAKLGFETHHVCVCNPTRARKLPNQDESECHFRTASRYCQNVNVSSMITSRCFDLDR